jgi:hypothetical protein
MATVMSGRRFFGSSTDASLYTILDCDLVSCSNNVQRRQQDISAAEGELSVAYMVVSHTREIYRMKMR